MTTPHAPGPLPLLLGVDGGGTKTTALLASLDGAILGMGQTGPSNYQQVGAAAAFAALDTAIAAAFHDARLSEDTPQAVCLGLAGVARQEDRDLVLGWTREHFADVPLLLVNDGALVLAAGTPEGWGVAVICGTGSIVIGSDRAGRGARVGGWGPLLGDEGSGYAVGRAALRAVMRAYDGRGPQTVLLERVLNHWQLPEPPSLVRRVYREPLPAADIAHIAPLVDRAAEEGDLVASAIIAEAGEELAFAVAAAAKTLGLAKTLPCALAGGFILHSPSLQAHLLRAASALGLRLDPITHVPRPAEGAVRLARRLLQAG